jgi:cytidylate kinase
MYHVLNGAQPHLNVAIIGPSGFGKTTYAYYALKTAWLLHAALHYCLDHNINREKCSIDNDDNALQMIIDYVVNVHNDNVCAKKYCNEHDAIDRIVQPVYYTGVGGMRELINILRNPEKYADRLRFFVY